MKNIGLLSFISLIVFCFSHGNFIGGSLSNAYAQEDWKDEYTAVCAKTQNAMILSSEELQDHIDRCDKLLDRIDELDGLQGATERKVYTKRLKMCRDLYDFALQYKAEKE
jgi:hypothetical protein